MAHGGIAFQNANTPADLIYAITDWNKDETTKSIVKDAWKSAKSEYPAGTRRADAMSGISRYSTESASEAVAEAFSEVYRSGESAKPLSIEIVRLLREGLR